MKGNVKNRVCAAVFVFAVIFIILTTWHMSGTLLDSDASSELVLAEHLAETGRILSEDWYYSTELRVVNTQLVFAPLFHIFDDWRLIRFTGALILQGILAASYYFFTRCAKLSRNDFLLGSALLLMPVSITYGRVVLWHSYYVPHIAFGFVIVGLFFQTLRGKQWLWGGLLIAASFLSGLGGVRQGAITHAPLAGLAFLYFIMKGKQGSKAFVWAIAAGLGALAGLIVNSLVLSEIFKFKSYTSIGLNLSSIAGWKKVLNGLLHQFGYRTETAGFMSALSMVCLPVGGLILLAALSVLVKPAGKESVERYVTKRFFPAAAGVLMCVFLLTDFSSPNQHVLYWTPVAVWAIPMITSLKDCRGCWVRRGIAAVMAISSIVNCGFVFSPDRFPQTYEGLRSFQEPRAVEKMTEAANMLMDEGYEIGYAPFWLGNILTEMTDGGLRTVTIQGKADGTGIEYRQWLSVKQLKETVKDRAFAIINRDAQKAFLGNGVQNTVEEIYRNDFFAVYDIQDVAAFQEIVGNH